MKKTILISLAVLIAILFTACPIQEQTKEEMLTTKNGWVLTAATSEPPYQMQNGDVYADLFNKGYFYDYELDDIYIYDVSHALKVDPGKKIPTDPEDLVAGIGYISITTLGQWVLNEVSENNTTLLTKVPSFYDKNSDGTWVMDKVQVKDITKTTLKYEFTWKVDEGTAKAKGLRAPRRSTKGDPEEYTWTLTFTAK